MKSVLPSSRVEQAVVWAVLLLAFMSLVGIDFWILSDQFREGKFRYLLLGFTVCVTWTLWRCNPFWAVFIGYASIRWILGDYQAHGVMDLLLVTACLVVGDAVRCVARNSAVAKSIAYVALAQGVYGMLQTAGIEPIFQAASGPYAELVTLRDTAIGTLGHPTMLAPFVSLGCLLFFVRKNWIQAAICAAGVAVCGSATGVVALGAGFLYILFRKDWRLAFGAAGLSAIGLAVNWYLHQDSGFFSFTGRLFIWPYGWKAFLEEPIFGWGPGAWLGLYPQWRVADQMRWAQLHNEYLQAAVEYGIVGLGIVLAGVAHLLWKAQRMCPTYGAWICALLAASATNFVFHVTTFGIVAAWLATAIHHHKSTIGETHGASTSKPPRRDKRSP